MLLTLTQYKCVESRITLQYTFEQKIQNTNWFFWKRKKSMVFWGFGVLRSLCCFCYMVLTSDTIYLSLIACHAIFSKKPKKPWFLWFSSSEGITTYKWCYLIKSPQSQKNQKVEKTVKKKHGFFKPTLFRHSFVWKTCLPW